MFLYSRGRNAVIAMLDIAMHQECGPVPLPGVCARTGLTLSYLEGLCRELRAGKLIKSERGPHGGFFLARQASNVTVADVFSAVGAHPVVRPENRSEAVAWPLTGQGPELLPHELWSRLEKQMTDFLSTVSLSDLMMHSGPATVLASPPSDRDEPIAPRHKSLPFAGPAR